MATIKFDDYFNEQMKDPKFKEAYEALDDEFKALEVLIKARNEAGLTQAQLARKMGISQPAVARIESGVLNIKYKTLLSYLKACGKSVAVV